MKYLYSNTQLFYTIANTAMLGPALASANQELKADQDISWTDFVLKFSAYSTAMRSSMIDSIATVFSPMQMLQVNGVDNIYNYSNVIAYISDYIERHSVKYSSAEYIAKIKPQVDALLSKLGIDPTVEGQVGVYYGNKKDFKEYFFKSDFLRDTIPPVGMKTAADFMNTYIVDTTYIPYKSSIIMNNTIVNKNSVIFPNPVTFKDVSIPLAEIEDFCTMPLWEHAWNFLVYTNNLIELGDFTLVINRDVDIKFYSLLDYISVLENLEPLPELLSDLQIERETYIFLLEHLNIQITNELRVASNKLRSQHEKLVNSQIKDLNNKIDQLSSKAVKEVTNSYGW